MPIDEFCLYLQGVPKSMNALPRLSAASEQAVLAALSDSLDGRQLRSKARHRLFTRIGFARVAYARLKRGKQTIPVLWTKTYDDELKGVAEAAQVLLERLVQCSSAARTRFRHCGIAETSSRQLLEIVKRAAAITGGAYKCRPQLAPPNRGDLAFNGLVALLAMAWEQQRKSASRDRLSEIDRRSPSFGRRLWRWASRSIKTQLSKAR